MRKLNIDELEVLRLVSLTLSHSVIEDDILVVDYSYMKEGVSREAFLKINLVEVLSRYINIEEFKTLANMVNANNVTLYGLSEKLIISDYVKLIK